MFCHFLTISVKFRQNFINFSQKNRKILVDRKTRMNFQWNEISFFHSAGNPPKFWRFFGEFLRSERCKGMQILYISKNAAKWAFDPYRSCRCSRERASQSLKVIQFIFSIRSSGLAEQPARRPRSPPLTCEAELADALPRIETPGNFSELVKRKVHSLQPPYYRRCWSCGSIAAALQWFSVGLRI